jgi:hypothetical protein
MTAKDLLLAALRGQRPPALPAAPCYLCLFLADFERTYYAEQYRQRMRGRTTCPIDHAEDTRLRAQAIHQAYGIFKARPDWIEVERGASRAWARRTRLLLEGDQLYYQDTLTGQRAPVLSAPLPRGEPALVAGNHSHQDVWDASGSLQAEADLDALVPLPGPAELLARGDFDLPRQVAADYGDRFFISTVVGTPYSHCYERLGFQGLMLIQHDRPQLFHRLLERQLAALQHELAAWAAVGLHGIFAEEIYSGADLISAHAYDEFVFSYNQPFFECMRQLGLLPIYYMCGDAMPRLERMAQLDVAALAVEESKKKFRIEIDEVVRRVGDRMSVMGNIDAVHFGLRAGLDGMAAEVRRQAASGARARGFVVSTGSPFPLDSNPRLIDTLVTTAHGCRPGLMGA